MKIYTIGHSNYSAERLVDMLRKYNINCIVDIRGIAYSQYNVQYNKDIIKSTLMGTGLSYIYMGNMFGANRETAESYNEEGYAEFHRVVKEVSFKRGIERLKDGCRKGYNIVLLGAMQDPIRCHRAILVGRELSKEGFDVNHIMHDYSIAKEGEIEKMLLNKYFPNRNQITLDQLMGTGLNENDMTNRAYKMANREIGRRVEKLDLNK